MGETMVPALARELERPSTDNPVSTSRMRILVILKESVNGTLLAGVSGDMSSEAFLRRISR